MSTEREGLAKMLENNSKRRVSWLDEADALLAAGVTFPPEPPALVTEEEVKALWCEMLEPKDWGKWFRFDAETRGEAVAFANALVESAIRRAVEGKTEHGYPGSGRVNLGTWVWPSRILAFFGLDGGAA